MDWLRLFDARGIGYSTSGPNVAKGNVTIHCPFCGADDPSQHLSVNLNGRGWRCWRRPLDHKGKSAARLIQALLNCSSQEAHHLAGTTIHVPSDFMERVQKQLQPQVVTSSGSLQMPKEFKLPHNLPSARPFLRYLLDRGFSRDEIDKLGSNFGIRYCTLGPFKRRIIFPIWFRGNLVTWTGRTVYPLEKLRYKTLTMTPEKAVQDGTPLAKGPITQYLLWFDQLMKLEKPHTIYLCEGPFDALKVRTLGRKHGICATCFFTSSPSDHQINLLHELLPRFNKKFLLLDAGTMPTAIRVAGMLSGLGIRVAQLPVGVKDPGELTEQQLLALK